MSRGHGLLHAYTDLRHSEETGSQVIVRGDGVFVYDEEGREYLEAVAGLWCTALGFGERELIEAAERQLRTLPAYHIAAGRTTEVAVQLADRLLRDAPGDFARVFFTNSGSEANDTQIKLLWLYNNVRGRSEKKKVISRRRAYHGATIATSSLTGIEANHANFDLPLSCVRHVSAPCHWEDALPGESEEEYASRLAAELESTIEAEGPETVAAFIAEPVMAAGGILPPPATYFARVQEVLARHEVRLIVDEVICGFGRLGRLWGSELYELAPDSLSCAKAMTSGYLPMGAVLIDEEMHSALLSESDRIGSFNHGFTFSGHPVSAAVALRNLELFSERGVVEHVQRVSPAFERAIAELRSHPVVAHTRSVGLLGGVQLASPLAREVTERAAAHGLLVRNLGTDTIALCPPLIVDEQAIELLASRLAAALDDAHRADRRDRG